MMKIDYMLLGVAAASMILVSGCARDNRLPGPNFGAVIYSSDEARLGEVYAVSRISANGPVTAVAIKRDASVMRLPVSTLTPYRAGFVTTLKQSEIFPRRQRSAAPQDRRQRRFLGVF